MIINGVKDIRPDIKYHKFRGVDGLKEFIHSFSDEIIVYFDPDVDGCFSGLFICKYLQSIGKRFSWYINSNREHGWTLPLNKIKGRNIIAVDFRIEKPELIKIVDNGCNIISIDHHLNGSSFIEYESESGNKGFVINNQYPFEEPDGKYLSGAGVVFEVLMCLNSKFNTLENRAMVGITLLSDVRDIENPNAKGYLYDLYNHKYKGYIKYLIEHTIGEKDYGFGVPRMDRNYVDYKFSPALNACFRFNEQDSVVEFLLGSHQLDLEYHKLQKELVNKIQQCVKKVEFSNLSVVYFKDWEVDTTYKDVLSSFVGLDASRNLTGNKSVICYMISKKDNGELYVKRASFRGNINGLKYLTALEGLIDGVGHEPAFGIKNLVPSKKLFSQVNKICKQVEENSHYIRKVINVPNMSMFINRNGKQIGLDNSYKLAQNMTYIRYTGKNIQRKRSGATYAEYSVDGVTVMNFDSNITFENGLVLPIMERGNLCLYLQSEDSEYSEKE